MMYEYIGLIVLAILGTAIADDSSQDQLFPNCDLVSVSHVNIRRNENSTFDIDFSWERKTENYEKIDGSIRQYVVRHGPLVNDEPTNQTDIMQVPADKDAVTIKDVKPCDKYFVQVCGVGNSSRFLFQDDLWDHAWIGWIGLSEYKADEKPKSDQQTTNPYSPRCDLVDTSYVSVTADNNTETLTVQFSWDKKVQSYEAIGMFDHYLVRYGIVSMGRINETDAYYMPMINDSTVFMLTDLQPGASYGLQICAMLTDDYGIDSGFDWSNKAWTGTMDFDSYESYARVDDSKETSPPEESESVEADTTTAPIQQSQEVKSVNPRCDLVQTSYVNIDADKNTHTLTVDFSWDKRQSSYDTIGSFDHYLVRHGPVSNGNEINEPDARYLTSDSSLTQFKLTEIPAATYYALQICAIDNDDMGINQGIDWRKEAWFGGMNFSSYDAYASVDVKSSEEDSVESDTQEVTEAVDTTAGIAVMNEPIIMAQMSLGSNGLLLLILSITSIGAIIVASACFILARKRRNAKLAAIDDQSITKPGLP